MGERGRKEKKQNFVFFKDLSKSDFRFSSEEKVKLVHASRTTCEYQNFRVSSNFMWYKIFLLWLFIA